MTVSVLSGWCSYSLLSRRARPSQANDLSTTHRRGRSTKPRAAAGRWTISRSIPYICRTHCTSSPRYVWSAHPLTSSGQRRRRRPNTQRAPSASDIAAVSTATPSSSPVLSTTRCRLRPFTFLAGVVAALPSRFGRFHALAVDDKGGWLRAPPGLQAPLLDQGRVDLFPGAVLTPLGEVVTDALPLRKLVGQQAPLAACAREVEQGVDHFPQVQPRRAPGAPGPLEIRADRFPLGIGQVSRVGTALAWRWHGAHSGSARVSFGPTTLPNLS